MAARKRKIDVQTFKNVYQDFKLPEFKNINAELDSEFTQVSWIETGEIDSKRSTFKLHFGVKNKEFNKLLKKDVLGILGWKGIPFDGEKLMYFIEKRFGSSEEQKELLHKLCDVFTELDKKIDMVAETSPQFFVEDAKMFNNHFESENFWVEFDLEKERVYVVLKSKGSDDFMTFAKANTPPKGWGGDAGDSLGFDHKVNLIPGYKNKPELKSFARSKCFWISAINYSMISTALQNEKKKEDLKRIEIDKWLDVPENRKRVENVLISEPNSNKLVLKFDEKRKSFIFSCPSFECTSFNSVISNDRKDALSMLFYSQVLCRPEKETDINRSEIYAVSREDDNDWSDYMGFSELMGETPKQTGKIILFRRADSKGKILYLNLKDNIDELESLKENYEKFKLEVVSKFKKFSLPQKYIEMSELDKKFPIMYLDRDTGKGYLLFNGINELSEDGKSHTFTSDSTLELSEKQVNQIIDGRFINNFNSKVYSNFANFHQLEALGITLSGEKDILFLEELMLSWKTQHVLNRMGIKFDSDSSKGIGDEENDENSKLRNSFKL